MSFAENLDLLIRSRYPLIYIITWEEERLLSVLNDISSQQKKALYVWSAASGLRMFSDLREDPSTLDPLVALEQIARSDEHALYLLQDFHPYFKEEHAVIIRKFRETTQLLKNSYKTLLVSSPIMLLPPELEKEATVLDFPLPTSTELRAILDDLINAVRGNPHVSINLSPIGYERMVKAALGLTADEAKRVYAKALVDDNMLNDQSIEFVIAEKEQIIKKTGILEYYHTDEQMENVGGLELLKNWLKKRVEAFSDKARKFGLPVPKGILLMGVQGCGKSLTAKVVASSWKLPLLRLDVGSVFSGIVGSSEANMRKAIAIAESIAPCVLWIDEIEKGFSGVASSNVSDAGATARIFGTFITWLQEKKSSVFVIATANDISLLPPELVRKGRFDEIFFVDLPNFDERKEIFAIHLKKRNRNPSAFPLSDLAEKTHGWSGAEIEEAVVASLFDAYEAGRDLVPADLEKNISAIVPLSKTMKESIEAIRVWASTRARPASKSEEPSRQVALELGS
jgi:ATP-dependent 26S proteasome regulatory subunit